MGRLTGCSAHQEIKVSSSSKCAIAHSDLFNSNRVNITDACKDGITVEELDLCCGSRQLPSCCGSHKNQSQFFSNSLSSSEHGMQFTVLSISVQSQHVTVFDAKQRVYSHTKNK